MQRTMTNEEMHKRDYFGGSFAKKCPRCKHIFFGFQMSHIQEICKICLAIEFDLTPDRLDKRSLRELNVDGDDN